VEREAEAGRAVRMESELSREAAETEQAQDRIAKVAGLLMS